MAQEKQPEMETVDLWTFIEGAIGFVSDVEHGGTRLVLTLDNRAVCVVVPMGDFQKLQTTVNRKEESSEQNLP
jgi:hypothetical protein